MGSVQRGGFTKRKVNENLVPRWQLAASGFALAPMVQEQRNGTAGLPGEVERLRKRDMNHGSFWMLRHVECRGDWTIEQLSGLSVSRQEGITLPLFCKTCV